MVHNYLQPMFLCCTFLFAAYDRIRFFAISLSLCPSFASTLQVWVTWIFVQRTYSWPLQWEWMRPIYFINLTRQLHLRHHHLLRLPLLTPALLWKWRESQWGQICPWVPNPTMPFLLPHHETSTARGRVTLMVMLIIMEFLVSMCKQILIHQA